MTVKYTEPEKFNERIKLSSLERARASAQSLKDLVKGNYSMTGNIELTALLEVRDEIVADVRKIEGLEDRIQLAHKELGEKVEKLAEMVRLLETADPHNLPDLLKPKATAEIQKVFRRKWLEATSAVKKNIPFYLHEAFKRYGFKIISANVDERFEHLTIEIRRKAEQKMPVIDDVQDYYAATVEMASAFGSREDTLSNIELFQEITKEPMPKKSADILLNAIRSFVGSATNSAASTAQDTS